MKSNTAAAFINIVSYLGVLFFWLKLKLVEPTDIRFYVLLLSIFPIFYYLSEILLIIKKDKKETKYYTKAKSVFLNLTFAMPFILTVFLVFITETASLISLIKNF
jgi:hypothetical protein